MGSSLAEVSVLFSTNFQEVTSFEGVSCWAKEEGLQ